MTIPIITIQGPTASGKSDLACRLAEVLDTEIISADSRQVYKFLDIGTAKPPKSILSQLPHHLIDIITPDKRYSTGAFVKDADAIIQSMNSRGKVPIICGGTMLYIQSLLHGLSEIPEIPVEVLSRTEAFLRDNTLKQCYDFVTSFDPQFASQISATDRQRIARAISVWFAFETPLTAFWEKQIACHKYLSFNIYVEKDRKRLYGCINKRMSAMITAGLLDEIRSILGLGYVASDPGLNTVGYKEFVEMVVLDDVTALSACIDLACQHTRNYAKRQMTWYRKCEFDFVYDGGDILGLHDNILRFLES